MILQLEIIILIFYLVFRFIEVEEIHEPRLIIIVGTLGLLVNVVGLFLFHGEYETLCL